MEYLIFIIVFFIAIMIAIIIEKGKKSNGKILSDLNEVLNSLNAVSSTVNNNERNAASRENSLRSLISKNEQKLVNVINQTAKNNESRVASMEDKIVNEIQTSSSTIQNSIQHSYSGLSKSLKGKINDIGTELNELQQNLRDFKNDILKTQAQSFSGVETTLGVIRKEEHSFLEHEFQNINKGQANINKCVNDVTNSINNHFTSLKPLEELLGRVNKLYNNLISLDKDILNQEKSLNGMVEKHTKILEYTQELQRTSEEIFDLMKLLVMDSVVKQTTHNK